MRHILEQSSTTAENGIKPPSYTVTSDPRTITTGTISLHDIFLSFKNTCVKNTTKLNRVGVLCNNYSRYAVRLASYEIAHVDEWNDSRSFYPGFMHVKNNRVTDDISCLWFPVRLRKLFQLPHILCAFFIFIFIIIVSLALCFKWKQKHPR